MTDVLLCVGNNMMGDDGADPLLTEKCATTPKGNWIMIDGGSASESNIVTIHELRPTRLLIVDAMDMGLNPGEIRIINPAGIAEIFTMTTHNMPLNYLINQLKEDIGEVISLDIQPNIVGFYYPMTQQIKDAVETVYQRLEGWEGNGGFAQLAAEEEQFFSKEFRELNIGTGMRAFLLSLVLPVRVTNFAEYLPMSDGEYTQRRALKPLLTLPYDAEQTQHFREVGIAGVTLEKMPNEEGYWQLTAENRAGKS